MTHCTDPEHNADDRLAVASRPDVLAASAAHPDDVEAFHAALDRERPYRAWMMDAFIRGSLLYRIETGHYALSPVARRILHARAAGCAAYHLFAVQWECMAAARMDTSMGLR